MSKWTELISEGWRVMGALLLAGCSMSSRPKAAQTLHCPEAQLQVEGKTAFSELVTGCGRSDVIVLDRGAYTSVLERAAFELSCPDKEIAVTVLDPSLYGATGCGRKISYKLIPRVGLIADTAQSTASPDTADPAAK